MYPHCNLLQKNIAYNYAYNAPIYVPAPMYQVPIVTLSAMPYTGLELGLGGTIAYWGFLVLWALLAAYLLIVKRVQNALADQLRKFV